MSGFFSGCTNDQLRQVELFADLDESTLDELRASSHFMGAHPGLRVITEGDTGFQLYVILSGEAEVRKGDAVMASLGQGDVFGEMSILSDRHRNADVVATSVMSMMSMTASAFREISQAHPEIERRIRQLAETRLRSG